MKRDYTPTCRSCAEYIRWKFNPNDCFAFAADGATVGDTVAYCELFGHVVDLDDTIEDNGCDCYEGGRQ